MEKTKLDIHNYTKKFNSAIAWIEKGNISKKKNVHSKVVYERFDLPILLRREILSFLQSELEVKES